MGTMAVGMAVDMAVAASGCDPCVNSYFQISRSD